MVKFLYYLNKFLEIFELNFNFEFKNGGKLHIKINYLLMFLYYQIGKYIYFSIF